MTLRWDRATPVALMGCVIDKKSAIGVARSQPMNAATLYGDYHSAALAGRLTALRRDRATPVALIGCVIDKKSAIEVARSRP